MKKTILIDARMYGLENTGIGRYLINLTEELKNLETKEHFIILLRKKYYGSLSFPDNWKKVLTDFSHYSLREQITLPLILKKGKPDLVHFPHFNIPFFWNGKFIVTIHDLTMHRQGRNASKLPLPLYFIKRIPYFILFKKAVIKAKKIIVPSNSVKKDIVNKYSVDESKINVLYEGVDDSLNQDLNIKEKKQILRKYNLTNSKYFIYVGNCYPHKNLERLIEAMSYLIHQKKVDVKLLIITKSDYFGKKLQRIVLNNQIKDDVLLSGFVPDGELTALYSQSIAFVYPSLAEGFGLQGLEAMQSKTLLLASETPVFKEIFESNAIYFNPFDFTSIAAKMEEVLNISQEKREERIQKAQDFIKRYSWHKMAEETIRVYNSII